jgi:hypothetical protein
VNHEAPCTHSVGARAALDRRRRAILPASLNDQRQPILHIRQFRRAMVRSARFPSDGKTMCACSNAQV